MKKFNPPKLIDGRGTLSAMGDFDRAEFAKWCAENRVARAFHVVRYEWQLRQFSESEWNDLVKNGEVSHLTGDILKC